MYRLIDQLLLFLLLYFVDMQDIIQEAAFNEETTAFLMARFLPLTYIRPEVVAFFRFAPQSLSATWYDYINSLGVRMEDLNDNLIIN